MFSLLKLRVQHRYEFLFENTPEPALSIHIFITSGLVHMRPINSGQKNVFL